MATVLVALLRGKSKELREEHVDLPSQVRYEKAHGTLKDF